MSIILAKLGISLASLVLVIICLSNRTKLTQWLETQVPAAFGIACWVAFRLLPFLAVYIIAGIAPTSDVNGFWDEASKASQGMVVYRDFWSPYSPLYAYYIGLWLKIWYSPKMIVFVMAVMDGIALWLSWHFFRPFQSKGALLFKCLIYFMLPGSLVLCIVGAQEDVWMWLFVVLAYLVRERTLRLEWYAVILAFGLLFTKAIFVLILVPLFFLEKQKLRLVIPIALIGITALGVLYPLVGMEFMQPLDEAKVLRAPNVLSVINPWVFNNIGVGEKFWNWIGLVASTGLGIITALRLKNADFRVMLSHVWVVMYATMMIVQQSAYSNYIFLFLIPLVFYIIDWNNRKQIGLLLFYNVLCVVHPSLWWRSGMVKYLKPADITAKPDFIVDYVVQVLIVLLTCYFVWLAFPKKKVT